MGRNKTNIDWKKVEAYAIAGTNGVQVAALLGIHYDTLVNRYHDERNELLQRYGEEGEEYKDSDFVNSDFSEYLRLKREKGNSYLLRAQYQKAINGDNTMQVWLGKQRLGQKDRVESQSKNINVDVSAGISELDELTEEQRSGVFKLLGIDEHSGEVNRD